MSCCAPHCIKFPCNHNIYVFFGKWILFKKTKKNKAVLICVITNTASFLSAGWQLAWRLERQPCFYFGEYKLTFYYLFYYSSPCSNSMALLSDSNRPYLRANNMNRQKMYYLDKVLTIYVCKCLCIYCVWERKRWRENKKKEFLYISLPAWDKLVKSWQGNPLILPINVNKYILLAFTEDYIVLNRDLSASVRVHFTRYVVCTRVCVRALYNYVHADAMSMWVSFYQCVYVTVCVMCVCDFLIQFSCKY